MLNYRITGAESFKRSDRLIFSSNDPFIESINAAAEEVYCYSKKPLGRAIGGKIFWIF